LKNKLDLLKNVLNLKIITKIVRSLVRRCRRATTNLPQFPGGTKFPIKFRFRQLFIPNKYFPAFIISPSKAKHYLSNDPLDERVLEEIIGSLSNLFFPKIPENVKGDLNKGSIILDIGAFNGGWGVEMLMNYPETNAIFLEPNPEKCMNIKKTLNKTNLSLRGDVVQAGIAKESGEAWLIKSEDGAWGDWLEHKTPTNIEAALKVNTITLIEALNGHKPTIVKCNAEGGEFEFINQLLVTDLRPKLLILMIHPEMGNMDNLWESLIKASYKIEKVKEHPRRPVWHAKWNESSHV
jgi:FkbM family methyltransferase